MSSTLENKILNLQERLKAENKSRDSKNKNQFNSQQNSNISNMSPEAVSQNQQSFSVTSSSYISSPMPRRPKQLGDLGTPTGPRKQLNLPVQIQPYKRNDTEFEAKLQEIMKMNGILCINNQKYHTRMEDLEHLGELGNGTCGHVVKMKHKPSGVIIAVKQMRRSGNSDENKRIIMDLDVVLKSHDCPYIVQCLGCFISESDVWICMELMATCLDKLLKRSKQAIPEDFLGKVTLATVKALSYLKEKHGVIHRDVKPSNILLDERGGVKLCDFGISGRLVDSKAKTRSAGCAAYMAPERIDPPDPTKPDYDIRADVWSLGITLVELATGVFPYRDCKTDFEVLSRVVQDDPPTLPNEAPFSKEFRSFVNSCLTKNYKYRPKYKKLIEHPFIQRYERQNTVNAAAPGSDCLWFYKVMQKLEPRLNQQKRNGGHISLKQTVNSGDPFGHPLANNGKNREYENNSSYLRSLYSERSNAAELNNYGNTYGYYSPYALRRRDSFRLYSPASIKLSNDGSVHQKYLPYRLAHEQQIKDKELNPISSNGYAKYDNRPHSPYSNNSSDADSYSSLPYKFCQAKDHKDQWQLTRPGNTFPRDYSPWRRENVDPPGVVELPTTRNGRYSTFLQQRLAQMTTGSQFYKEEQNALDSPILHRKRYPSEPPPESSHHSRSPQLIVSRFNHQKKEEPLPQSQLSMKESAKKRFATYVRLRLGGDRTASPEPPPRLNRESPLFIRKNFGEQGSPLFPRRYVSPSPPVPPPRRLLESSSMPGSPQHLYSRLHFTPELQRRLP